MLVEIAHILKMPPLSCLKSGTSFAAHLFIIGQYFAKIFFKLIINEQQLSILMKEIFILHG